MAYSFTEKKRIRKDFGKRESILEVPYLLAIQLDSYRKFLQADASRGAPRRCRPARRVQERVSDRQLFGQRHSRVRDYRLGDPVFDVKECQLRGLTYAAPLRVKVRLVVYDKETSTPTKKTVKDIREQEVYLGEMPLDDRQRHVRRQRHRARHRLPAAPLARRVLRSRPRQDAQLGQAAVLRAHHSLPRLVARFRVRSEGLCVCAYRPAPQAAGHDHPARSRLHRGADARHVLRQESLTTCRRTRSSSS